MTDKKTIFKSMLCISLLLSPAIVTAGPYSHLEPLPLARSSFDSTLFNSLLLNESPHLYMVWLPSLRPPQQSAIMIDCEIEYEKYTEEEFHDSSWDGPKIKSKKWILKYSVFKNRLKVKQPLDLFQTYDVNPTNDIKRLEIKIDDEFANLMTEAWLHVLRETRYPAEWKPQTVLDGSSYIFKCDDDQTHFRYYGMTDSSSDVELDDLGRMLISLVKADEHDREQLHKQCVELASNIIKKKHPNQQLEPTVKTPVDPVNVQGTDTAHP